MKTAIITGVFPKASETFVVNQVQIFKKKFDETDFFCLRKDMSVNNNSDFEAEVISANSIVPRNFKSRFLQVTIVLKKLKKRHYWPFIKSLNIFKYGVNSLNGKQFYKTYLAHFFDINQYDLLQIHFGTTAVSVLPYLKKFSKKVVVSFHGFDAHKFDTAYYKHLSELNNIRYTVNSNYLKQRVLTLGVNSQSIHVISTPIDDEFLITNNRKINNSNTFRILFVGRLIELKAPDLAIEIVKEFIKETDYNVSFDIVGHGDYINKCNELIKRYNLHDVITIYQELTHSQVKKMMSQSDVFLFPARVDSVGCAEAQGLVIQEAQAMGLPVLVTSVGGIGEGVQNDKTGFVLNEPSIEDFVKKLKFLKNNPLKANKMGVNGHEYVSKNFSSISYFEQYYRAFISN